MQRTELPEKKRKKKRKKSVWLWIRSKLLFFVLFIDIPWTFLVSIFYFFFSPHIPFRVFFLPSLVFFSSSSLGLFLNASCSRRLILILTTFWGEKVHLCLERRQWMSRWNEVPWRTKQREMFRFLSQCLSLLLLIQVLLDLSWKRETQDFDTCVLLEKSLETTTRFIRWCRMMCFPKMQLHLSRLEQECLKSLLQIFFSYTRKVLSPLLTQEDEC